MPDIFISYARDDAAAAKALAQALDVCERAGLIAQSIQAMALRAVILSRAEKMEAAVEAAKEATDLADRLHYPLGSAAALEAKGATTADPEEGARALVEARDAWRELGRPLDAARTELIRGQVLQDTDSDAAAEALDAAASEFERLGVAHLSERAKSLAA